MRIGIDAQRIFRRTIHGMEVVAIETIKELQKIDSNHEFIIYTRKDTQNTILSESDNFRIKEIPAFSFPDWEQYRLLREAKKDSVDILHCMSNTGPVFYKKKLFLTLHDIIYMESIKFAGNPYQDFGNIYRRLIVPKVVRNSDVIFTVSKYEKERIIDFFKLPEERVKVLYNGVNPIFSSKQIDKSNTKDELSHLPNDYILFLGNTAPKKNTIRLLEAYYRAHQEDGDIMPLVILDLSLEYLQKHLPKEIRNIIMEKVILLKYIPYSEMPLLYRKASIFVYPSLRESFGMPILEAMACGTPVITSDTTSMPEVAGGNALLCDPFSIEDIAEKILRLASDGKLRDELIVKGSSWAKQFSWQKTAHKLMNSYD